MDSNPIASGLLVDELAPDPDPEALRIKDFDIRNAVFVLPLDAPVPSEISEIEMPKGSLYKRLAALDSEDLQEFAFVPLSGSELLALDRIWKPLQRARRVFALFDLPGARYDVLFTQAVRQIGIHRVEWPAVSQALALRIRTVQRTADVSPWDLNPKLSPDSEDAMPRSSTHSLNRRSLPIPVSDENEDPA